MPNTLEPVEQSRTSVDPAFLLSAPIKQYIVSPALCRCHRSVARDEGTDAAAQLDAIRSAENSIHDEVTCIPEYGSTSNETKFAALDDGCSIPPSRTLLELSSSSGTSGTARKEWKEEVRRKNLTELCLHCFLSSFFPGFSEGAYMLRINSLPMFTEEPFNLTSPFHHAVFSSTQATREIWPVGLEERAYYQPLTEVLNEILEQFKLNHGKGVRFITYDRPMAPVKPQSLKPGLFLVDEELANLDLFQWKHPILPLEVNGNFWDGLKQLSSYTRELLSARPGRQVCWIFHFDHTRSKFRAILFTPDSIQCSQPAVITTPAGYRDMVKLVVALLSRPNHLTIGEDSSRDSRTKVLPDGDKLEMLAVEFDSKPFIGRRTRIMSAVVVESGNTAIEYKKSSADDTDYVLKQMQQNPHETITFTNNRDHLEVGEHLIIKESWPLESRSNVEWSALTSCLKEFGLPEVVYRVTGKHPIPGVYTQKPRVPQQLALKEKGLDLRKASSPRILLTAVLHAIVGHWNLFKKGWLHRDVSIGNVLILKNPVQKLEPLGFDWMHDLTECRGMLIDGDAMIRQDVEREPGLQRVCTLPFLSGRLAAAWSREKQTFDQYFDDLESFAWVLLWALLEVAENHKGATKIDRAMMNALSRNDLPSIMFGKGFITQELKRVSAEIAKGLPKEDPTSLLDPFTILLDQWFDLIMTKRPYGNAGTLPSNEDSTEFYNTFITLAMNIIPDLPEKWHLDT